MSDATYTPDTSAWFQALESAQRSSTLVADSTTPAADLVRQGIQGYISADGLSGYGVSRGGELVGVFSTVKGRGDGLVESAKANGAWRLDCFDGYLVRLYSKHGFAETGRVQNWAPGGADVVYMAIPSVNWGSVVS